MSSITAYCHISNTSCHLNGALFAEYDSNSEDGWLKQLYKLTNRAYPKFYKMDMLSQVGYLTSEFIKAAHKDHLTGYVDDAVALVFANCHSSAESDIRFQNSYEIQHTPSPAMFVYTLPNIVLGELAIANKWYGENMFAILPKFTADFYVRYAEMLMTSGSEAILAGWLDVTDEKTEAFVFLLEKNTIGREFNTVNLSQLFDKAFN